MNKFNLSFITLFLIIFFSSLSNIHGQSIEDYAEGKVKSGDGNAFFGFYANYNIVDEMDGGFGAGLDIYGSKNNKPTFYTSISVSGLKYEDDAFDLSSKVTLLNLKIGGALDGTITPYLLMTNGTTKVEMQGISAEDSEWKIGAGIQFHIKTDNTIVVPGFEYNSYTEALALKIGILISSN